jgi:uncharacterized protein
LVAGTSPLISLIVIDKLPVLITLYEEVYIPNEVWNELNTHLEIGTYKKDLQTLSYFVKTVETSFYSSQIDKGESEAIALYRQLNADFVN